MQTANKYLSLIKFSHTIFALPFAMIGFFLAIQSTESQMDWVKLLLVVLCMVFARSAAMAFNRFADQDIDAQNIRTKIREIPAGILKSNSVLIFTIINAVLFVVCTYFINPICFYLSPIALFITLGYSYTKRFSALAHFILGIGLSLAPIGAYLAITGVFNVVPLIFSAIVLFWVAGFDIIYALQDEGFDKELKLHSIPSWLGKKNALKVSDAVHLFTGSLILFLGYYAHFGLFYWIGALIFVALLAYQHKLVKPNDLSKINLAFFTTNGIASVIFAIFVIADLYWKL